MAITCNYNGSLCTRFFSENSDGSNTTFGFIIGSITGLIVIVVVILIMYILCCKRYIRKKPPVSSQQQPSSIDLSQSNFRESSEEQPTSIDLSQSYSRESSEEQPPSYQEANNTVNATNLYQNT